jgi:hypothetical protein
MNCAVLGLFEAVVTVCASAWAGASAAGGMARTVPESLNSRLSPTIAELAAATCTGIEKQGPVTLEGDRWEGQLLIPGDT